MITLNNKISLLLFAIVLPIIATAQDVSFTATGPGTVQVGEQFKVTYEINDRVRDFTPPQFNDFMFISSQQGISTINWKTTQQFVYIFRASKEGTYTIGPAKAKSGGKTIESNSITIKVTASTKQQPQSSNGASSTPKASSDNGDDVFVRLLLNKSSAYVGEQVTAYVKVYTKLRLSGIDNSFKGPDFTGFYIQNVDVPDLRSLEPEEIGGVTYYSGVLRKLILIPQTSGEITIPSFEVDVQQDKKVRIGHFTTYQPQNVPLNTKAVKVNVKPLPVNKPAGFSGAIGDFTFSATMSPDKVKTNDAVIFNLKVNGTGNIKLIDKVHSELPPTFDVFDPVIKTNMSESGYSGTKTFEITAIPRHAGEFTIKPFEFVYFNPSSGKYITKKSPSFVLNVEKVVGDSNSVVISNLSRSEVELLESDIRFIKTDTKLFKNEGYLISSVFYYLILIIGILIFLLYIIVKREQIKRNADIARTRHKKAKKLAGKRFKQAKMVMEGNKPEAFYDELSKAIWGYVSDKLSIPRSELSVEQAKQKLIDKEIDEEIVNELMSLVENCEFARYAPGSLEDKPAEMLAKASKIVSKIEQNF